MPFNKIKTLLLSKTAQNTYLLFVGNLIDAVFAFLFTMVSFRLLNTEGFGIFSAVNNFVVLIFTLMDLGISSSLINFIPQFLSKNDKTSAEKYQYNGITMRLLLAVLVLILLLIFSPWIAKEMFMTTQYVVVVLAGIAILGLSGLDVLFFSLQARSKFWQSAVSSIAYSISRVLMLGIFILWGGQYSYVWAMIITALSPFWGVILSSYLLKLNIIKLRFEAKILKNMIGFGGWLGLVKILTSLAGRIDVQIILWISGSFQAGIYSVATRLASFYPVIMASFTAVLAPRLAGNINKRELKTLLSKSFLGVMGLISLMVIGILISKPLILTLFGYKALTSVMPFQLLTLAFMPFMLGSLAVSVIIYKFKQPKFMSIVSTLQLAIILAGGWLFVPVFGVNGIVLAIGVSNLLMMFMSYYYVYLKWQKLQ
jgi:O-antigen/teichoic acid export membrane protein